MSGITHLEQFQEPALKGLIDESQSLREEMPTFAQQYLPNERVYSTTFAYDIIKKSKNLATFIGYGAEPAVMDRDAVASKFGTLAAFGLQYVATVEELMAINQARSTGEKQALISKLEKKAVDVLEGIQDFADVLASQALTTGQLNWTKGEVKVDFDYQIPEEHKIALTGEDLFSDPNSDALGKLIEWTELYANSNAGKRPEEVLMPREVVSALTKNLSIISEARPGIQGVTRISQAEVNQVLNGFGLPNVRIIENRSTTVRNMYTGQDEVVEFYPAGRLVFLSRGLGNFFYGPNPEANDFEPGIVLRAADEQRPKRSIIEGYAAGFPIIEVPSLILHADVL